jgi:hypothetical protein
MRPSLGVTDLEGVIPWSPYVCNHSLDVHALTRIRLFDSLGVFSRDLDAYVCRQKFTCRFKFATMLLGKSLLEFDAAV